jgi:hypothetical protein
MEYKFTRLDVKQAEHEFAAMIKRFFGEVWRIPTDGEYKGLDGRIRSMVPLDNALWYLCQGVIHKGALRCAGRIELEDCGTTMRLVVLYEPVVVVEEKRILVDVK